MFVRLLAVLGLFGALAAAPQPAAAQQSLTVFAAASLKNALDDADAAFSKATGVKVVASYEASSALAKQIEHGAPADVFISADLAWMDYASEHKLIKPDTRFNLLGNRLVLIAPKEFETRQGRHRQGLRHRQARRRRTHRGSRRQGGPCGPLRQDGTDFARGLGGGRAQAGAGRERSRDARFRRAQRNPARHRLCDRRQDRAEGENRRRIPR